MLDIQNLSVNIEDKPLLQNLTLTIPKGEIHAIMGPNGAGKSTLAKVIAGHPAYEITHGSILFEGKNIVELEPEERAQLGIFMSFQYPIEIPGVSNTQFLMIAKNAILKAQNKEILTKEAFDTLLQEKMQQMEIRPEFAIRNVNEGFSGGEKKRNEILQMAVIDPTLAILDETDSGLDIDALRIVAQGVNKIASKDKSILLITHYQRLLDYIKPHVVHVMINGRIVHSGGPELALKLEKEGYDWILSKGAQC